MHAQVLNVNENVLYFTFEFQHIYTPYAPDVRVQPKKKKLISSCTAYSSWFDAS